MKYSRFEQLPVWKAAIELAVTVESLGSSLQNTEIRGTRYLTDKSRRAETQRRERDEFLKELAEIRNRNAP